MLPCKVSTWQSKRSSSFLGHVDEPLPLISELSAAPAAQQAALRAPTAEPVGAPAAVHLSISHWCADHRPLLCASPPPAPPPQAP